MNFHVMTLFPEMIENGLSVSITGRAQRAGLFSLDVVNIRDFSGDEKHHKVDDYPYGGGAGLLMQAQPVFDAHRAIVEKSGRDKIRTVYLTPQGKCFDQKLARELSMEEDLIFLCGHYEGIDERVLEEVVTDYVSIGDFVLTGGELAAMVMIDAVARLLPDVLHNESSALDESFSGYLLEYPQYTRPDVWHDKEVPEALRSGDHKKVRQWQKENAELRTRSRRPDLYAVYERLMQLRAGLLKEKLVYADLIGEIDHGTLEIAEEYEGNYLLKSHAGESYYLYTRGKQSALKLLGKLPVEFGELICHKDWEKQAVDELGIGDAGAWSEKIVYTYTRKESMAVRGRAYLTDGKWRIEALREEQIPLFVTDDDDRPEERRRTVDIQKLCRLGRVYAIYAGDKPAGFGFIQKNGEVSVPVMRPDAAEGMFDTLFEVMSNTELTEGFLPFCRMDTQNREMSAFLEREGFYPAKSVLSRKKCCKS